MGGSVFDRILVAFDDSAAAHKAFNRGLALASNPIRQLAVLAVVDPSLSALEPDAYQIQETTRGHYEALFRCLKYRAQMRGIEPELAVRLGDPANEIVSFALDWQASLIVTGVPRGGSVQHLLFGSYSRRILDDAHCSVMITR